MLLEKLLGVDLTPHSIIMDPIRPGDGIFPGRPRKAGDPIENVRDALDPVSRLNEIVVGYSVREAKRKLRMGDHIKVYRSAYSHHGIYDGNGFVYEYSGMNGTDSMTEGVVRRVPLERFAAGDAILRVDSHIIYSPEQVIANAKSRLGESAYNPLTNNCEQFALWCRDNNYDQRGSLDIMDLLHVIR